MKTYLYKGLNKCLVCHKVDLCSMAVYYLTQFSMKTSVCKGLFPGKYEVQVEVIQHFPALVPWGIVPSRCLAKTVSASKKLEKYSVFYLPLRESRRA